MIENCMALFSIGVMWSLFKHCNGARSVGAHDIEDALGGHGWLVAGLGECGRSIQHYSAAWLNSVRASSSILLM